jgi:uncharacterized protein
MQTPNDVSAIQIPPANGYAVRAATTVKPQAYPGFAQAILLITLLVTLQVALTIPFLVLGLMRHPAALAMPTLIGTIVAAVYGYSRNFARTGDRFREVFPIATVSPQVLLSLLLTVFGFLVLNLQVTRWVARFMPPPKFFARFVAEALRGQWPLEIFLTVAIILPLGEEFLFRGVILHAFLSRYGAKKAIIGSALLFALMHGNPWQFVTGISLGIFLAWCVVRTRSLIPCLFAHFANNAMAFLLPRLQSQMPATAKWTAAHTVWVDLAGILLAVGGIYSLQRLSDGACTKARSIPEEIETCAPNHREPPEDVKENS